MPEEFIMRGQTADSATETLNFSGKTPGYGYRLIEFEIYPSTGIGATEIEAMASITAAKTSEDPQNPNFNNPGLIATAVWNNYYTTGYIPGPGHVVINDLFVITQDLILRVKDSTSANPVNWQCKFKKVKLSSSAEAVANFNQFTIFDG